jgi:hypothetical protein
MDIVNGLTDIKLFVEPDAVWDKKLERKEERSEIVSIECKDIKRGYSEQGSLYYPQITSF